MIEKPKLKGYLALALVFVLGIIAGGAGVFAFVQRKYGSVFSDRSDAFENRRMRAFARHLDLDDTEQTKVRAVMDKYAAKRRELTRDMLSRCGDPLRDQKAQMDAEIRALLRPDQQARYDELLKDQHDRVWGGGK
jgi:Spy/CpxP family protein refolding chaperone